MNQALEALDAMPVNLEFGRSLVKHVHLCYASSSSLLCPEQAPTYSRPPSGDQADGRVVDASSSSRAPAWWSWAPTAVDAERPHRAMNPLPRAYQSLRSGKERGAKMKLLPTRPWEL